MKLRTCTACGRDITRDPHRCTNGRCGGCHQNLCTPGGKTSPGHGLGTLTFGERQNIVARDYYYELLGLTDWSAARYASFMHAAIPLARYAKISFSQYERRLAARIAQDAISAADVPAVLGRPSERLDPERGVPEGVE